MLRSSMTIAACFLAFSPLPGRAADCSFTGIAKQAQIAAASATSAGQEQSRKLAAEAQRLSSTPQALLNVAPDEQMPGRDKARKEELKQQISYWRLHQHYLAEAFSIEAQIAEAAEAARQLQSGAPRKPGEQQTTSADILAYLRENFPEPRTELGAAAPASVCDLPHALRALEHATADELNATPLGQQSARLQSLARKYKLDMSRAAWANWQTWLEAIPTPQERKSARDDMALIWRARRQVELITDLQNLGKLFDLSRKRFHILDDELARLARAQAFEQVGEAWNAYISSASPEERKLGELLDFMQRKNKADALANDPRTP